MAHDSKTEKPTPRRRQKAREQGQVARSRDLAAALSALAALLMISVQIPSFALEWRQLFSRTLAQSISGDLPFDRTLSGLSHASFFPRVAATLAVSWLVATSVLIAQGGMVFASSAIAPSLGRISPTAKLEQLFSLAAAKGLLKSLLPAAAVMYLAYSTVVRDSKVLLDLDRQNISGIMAFTLAHVFEIGWKSGVLLLLWAGIDYSSAQVDRRRIGQLAMAIQGAFQDLGVFQGSPIRGLSDQTSLTQVAIAKKESTVSHAFPAPAPSDVSRSDDEAVTQLRQELTEALSAEISEQKIALRHERNGLVISLREVGFFDSGSAHIKPESLSAFDRIETILRDKKYPLRIEGHTVDVPIHTSQFASNWELSAARATELVRTLIVRNGFPADRLSAGGFAEFHPVATNRTADGRAQNRRVDVVILERSPNAASRPAPTGDR